MIGLSTIPWSAPETRAGKTFRRAPASPEFMEDWRKDSALLKAQGVWLGAYSGKQYWIFKFEASGKPEEGKSERGCKLSMKPAGQPARPEAEVTMLPCALRASGCDSSGAETVTPTTGPLASSLHGVPPEKGRITEKSERIESSRPTILDAPGNVDQSPERKALIVAGDQPTARTLKAGASKSLKGVRQTETLERNVDRGAGNRKEQCSRNDKRTGAVNTGAAKSVINTRQSFPWLTQSTPADETFVTVQLLKRASQIITNTGQFYALCRRKDVKISGMKVGRTNGEMVCSMKYV